MRSLLFSTISLLTILASALFAESDNPGERTLRQKSERFDQDPNWDGQNNRVKVEKPNKVVQDFGYQPTNHAGGQGAGEIGGQIQRCTTPAWYGLRLEKPKTLNDKLRCAGTFAVTQTSGMSSLYFGWFNSQTMETRPRNWMGIMVNGEGKGCEIHAGYNTAAGQSDGFRATGAGPKGARVRDFNLIPNDGTPYTFEFVYDPEANGGIGEFTFTLGGKGPFTGGPFKFKIPAAQRQAGAAFDSFGIVNAQSAGNALAIYFDDLTIDGQTESFDADPRWIGQGNRAQLDDHGEEGAHQFGFSETSLAGGQAGECGGLMYSAPSMPGYYGDRVGKLTLDDPLTASGKITLTQYGSDGGLYLGWFNSQQRGYPPANLLGVSIEGTTSTGPRFEPIAASCDPKTAKRLGNTAPLVPPNGKSHTWKIAYDPHADGEAGRLTIWLDDQERSFALPPELRKAGATFDRFGLAVHQGGGRASRVFIDDLEYTASE